MDDVKIFAYDDVRASELLALKETHNIYIVAKDKRDKSYQQIKFMYVLLKEFSLEYYGESGKETLDEIKNDFYEDFARANNLEFYRTQTATVTQMRLFIDWLIKILAQEYGITIALEKVDDGFLTSWIYANTCSRKCCVCGAPKSDIHHCDKIGIGNNRKKMNHTKKRVISLCREHHTIEESTGKLLKEKGLYGVYLNENDFKRLGIKGDYFDEEEK